MDSRFDQPLQLDLSIAISGPTVGRLVELLLAAGASIRGTADVSQIARTKQQPEEFVLDRSQAAKLLKVCEATLFRMVHARKMPEPIRFGRTIRWCRDEIECWVKAGCPPMDSWNYQPKQKNV